MSKISNALLMLEYLNTGNKYTVKELASKLEITERMVRYYKKELESSGVYIDSFMGPNGGYFLVKNSNSYYQFNKYDVQLLERIYDDLKKYDIEYLDVYLKLIEKTKNIMEIEEEKSKFFNEFDLNDKNESECLFRKYIDSRSRVEILYKDVSGVIYKRWIHPLQIFKYNEKIYITAFCELRNDIRHFELDRIKIFSNQ